jgi:hypothetical protein
MPIYHPPTGEQQKSAKEAQISRRRSGRPAQFNRRKRSKGKKSSRAAEQQSGRTEEQKNRRTEEQKNNRTVERHRIRRAADRRRRLLRHHSFTPIPYILCFLCALLFIVAASNTTCAILDCAQVSRSLYTSLPRCAQVSFFCLHHFRPLVEKPVDSGRAICYSERLYPIARSTGTRRSEPCLTRDTVVPRRIGLPLFDILLQPGCILLAVFGRSLLVF